MMNNIDDLIEDDVPYEEINVEEIVKNFPNYTSQKLCDIIVCDRYLGLMNDLSILCMKELVLRREKNEIFNFEEYIDQKYNELPKIDFSFPDIGTIIKSIKK